MIHTIRQVLNGTKEIGERFRYQFLCAMSGGVHIFFTLFFLYAHVTILTVYNAVAVLFYFTTVFLLGKIRCVGRIFLCVFLEILTHVILATLLVGWGYGFVNYLVPMLPMSFYIAFMIPSLKKYMLTIPAVCSAAILIVFLALDGFATMNGPIYGNVTSDSVMHKVYLINIVLVFLFLWAAAMLFSIEIRYMQRHLEEENLSLSRMANYDALTKLLNRRSMNILLKQAVEDFGEGDDSFCLIMADIDDFKKVNDTYGHSFGDEVLIEVAGVLQSNVREGDRVCRWGGEEMLILIRSNMEVARNVAQRICSDMAATFVESGDKKVSVTLTLGVAEHKKGETIRASIETADQRLYRGKRAGKNCVIWN